MNNKYNNLWDKYKDNKNNGFCHLPLKSLASQEEAVDLSLKIKTILNALANDNKINPNILIKCFKDNFHSDLQIVFANVLSYIRIANNCNNPNSIQSSDFTILDRDKNEAYALLQENNILFKVQALDDLFLNENDKLSLFDIIIC